MEKPMQVFTRLLISAIIMSLSACSTTPPKESPEPESFNQLIYNKAKAAFLSGDYKTASTLFETLAENGNAEAQYSIGYMHYYGKGLPKNLKQAMYWFKLSAQQGHQNAIEAMATIDTLLKQHQPGSSPATENKLQQANEIVGEKKPDGLIDLRTSKPPVTVSAAPVASENLTSENLAKETNARVSSDELMPPEQVLPYEQSPPIAEPEAETTVSYITPNDPEVTDIPMLPHEKKSTKWILKQPSNHFTIQLASSTNYRRADKFANSVPLDGVYFFKSKTKGQLWYSVIHGSFSSYGQAKNKLKVLTERGYKGTWIRSIKGIQNIIKSSQ